MGRYVTVIESKHCKAEILNKRVQGRCDKIDKYRFELCKVCQKKKNVEKKNGCGTE